MFTKTKKCCSPHEKSHPQTKQAIGATILILIDMFIATSATTSIPISSSSSPSSSSMIRFQKPLSQLRRSIKYHYPLISPKHLTKSLPCPLWSSSFSFCLQQLHSSSPLSRSSFSAAPFCTFSPLMASQNPSAVASSPQEEVVELKDNPLLKDFGFPPFDVVEAKHVRPAIRAILSDLENELVELEKSVEPTWPKLVDPLDKLIMIHVIYFILLPEKVKFNLRLGQSKPIYNAFKAIRESSDWNTLSDARKRIVEVGMVFRELEKLSQKFEENVLDATKKFEKLITDKKEIDGLPASALGLAAQTGHEKATAEEGPWMITLDAPSFLPVMQHSHNRSLREEVYRAYVTRASSGDLDNSPIIGQILKLRLEKAKLLGYNNYAEELLKKLRTASWDAAVQVFLLVMKYIQLACKEIIVIRMANASIDINEELRPYCSLPKVMDGLFSLAKTLFDIDVWNNDVRFYRIKDSLGNPIAYFYFDPYSRPSEKCGGAWMDEVVVARIRALARDGASARLPVVETVFHEFGHALQHMLTKEDEGLVSALQNTMKLERTFRAGTQSLRQIKFASTDLELHVSYIPGGSESIFDIDRRVREKTQVIAPLPEDMFLCGFSHIFAEFYYSYYSYKWADVLSADAFSAFEDAGLDNEKAVKETGRKFRETVLALGSGKPPLEVFVQIRGREPSPEALLRHNGLLAATASA
ncbi:hypothetical protein MKW92_038247 [Papaver armeniacum]|nr:hypothetical protein MKW92_038247 [Papaver armeniacum]